MASRLRNSPNTKLVDAVYESKQFTESEKRYIEFQYGNGSLGHFHTSLFQTMSRADGANLSRLAMGFPLEAAAFMAWTEGDLYVRVNVFRKEIEDAERNRNQDSKETV